MKAAPCDILGIGTPILDNLIKTSHEAIARLPGKPNGSIVVDNFTFSTILEDFGPPSHVATGGSAANTIKGLAKLGKSCRFLGKIGDDAAGKTFTDAMKAAGVITELLVSEKPTGQVVCLIAPDSQRTMRSCLGAGVEMNAEDLVPELFEGVKLVHIEGYLVDRPELIKKAMVLAKAAKAKISFDLSSYEIVIKHKKQLVDLISKNVDILFANDEEAKNITGMDPEKGCLLLRDVCETAIVKMGPSGCWVANQDGCYHQKAIVPKVVVDTTGAGDLFSSGFLYGYLEDADIRTCAHYGALVASYAISVLGTELSEDVWEAIRHGWKPV
ncbi:putative sugar kinase YdjH [subsurface metagenome]